MRISILKISIRQGLYPLILISILALAGAFISGIAPLVLGDSVTRILDASGYMTMTFSGLRLLIFIGIGALLVQLCGQILQKLYARKFLEYWVPTMARKVTRIDLAEITSYQAGYLNRRISTELRSIPALFSIQIPGLLEAILVAVFSLIMLIILLPKVSISLVAVSAVLIPLGILFMKGVKKLHKEVIESWSSYEGTSTDYVTSQLQIRSFGAESRMLDYITLRLKGATRTDLFNSIKILALFACLVVLVMGGIVGFLLYAEQSPHIATAQAGTVIAFLGYLWVFFGRISGITAVFSKVQSTLANMDRMAEFLDMPETAERTGVELVNDRVHTVSLSNIISLIDGEQYHTGISLLARTGDIVAIRGKSGSGKTTFLRTIYGLSYRPEGAIRINGEVVSDIKSLGDSAILLPQEIRFFAGSLKWNMEILTGRSITDPELTHVLESLGLSRRLCSKYFEETNLNEAGSNLSGGEKQRLALASVILRQPSIIMLDEPTSQVDEETEQAIMYTVKELAQQGSIIFIVAHSALVLDIATQVIDIERYSV